MTKHAQLVLSDARMAAKELSETGLGSEDASTIRRRTVAVMALLRAVGNVLYEVDGPQGSAYLRQAIAEKWAEPKPPAIWAFIDGYRSALLKRYEHPETDFNLIIGTEYPVLIRQHPDFGELLFDTVVELSIQFWEDYLADVDRRAEMFRQRAEG